jgi:SlyX protein
MEHAHDTERRLVDLEIKVSFHEELLDSLNQTIIRQQQQLDRIARALEQMRQLIPEDSPGSARSLREDLPPHY